MDPLKTSEAAAAAAFLSAACPWHPVTERRLRRKLFAHAGYDPELALAARGPDGRLESLAAAVMLPGEGRDAPPEAELVALGTRLDLRGRGLARRLYAEIETRLRLRGVGAISIWAGVLSSGVDLRYAGAATMLLRRLFAPTKVVYDMALAPGLPIRGAPTVAGYELRALVPGDAEALRALCTREFPDWGYAAGLIRPGEPCGVVGAFDPAGGIAAFAGWNEYIFGPTGTRPEHRGRGLGEAVFWMAVGAMRDAGFEDKVCISVAVVDYYARAFGCHVASAAWHMRKELGADAAVSKGR